MKLKTAFITVWLGGAFFYFIIFAPQLFAKEPNIQLFLAPGTTKLIDFLNSAPGQNQQSIFSIKNNTLLFQLLGVQVQNLKQDKRLADFINLKFKDSQKTITEKSLSELKKETELVYLAPQEKKAFWIESSLSPKADNSLQNKKIVFDLKFGFIAGKEKEPKPTATTAGFYSPYLNYLAPSTILEETQKLTPKTQEKPKIKTPPPLQPIKGFQGWSRLWKILSALLFFLIIILIVWHIRRKKKKV